MSRLAAAATSSPPSPFTPSSSSSSGAGPLTKRTNLFFSSAAKSKPLAHTVNLLHLLPAKDAVTWNIAISACLRHGRSDAALRVFLDMLLSSSTTPDAITLRSVLRASWEADAPQLLPQLHAYVIKLPELFSSTELMVLNTCLITFYCRVGSLKLAHNLFAQIPDRDIVAFTSLMTGYVEDGQLVEALGLFKEIVGSDNFELNEYGYSCALRACACAGAVALFEGRQIHGRVIKSNMSSNVFVGTTLVDLYARCNLVELARRAFCDISEPNVVSWNALLAGSMDGKEAMMLLGQMRLTGISPDHITYANTLRACRNGIGIEEIWQLHCLIVKNIMVEFDPYVSGALFEVYLSHCCLHDAQKVFDEMEETDDAVYNIAIQGCIRNGYPEEAMKIFIEGMKLGKELRGVTATSLLAEVGLSQGKQLHAIIVKLGELNSNSSPSVLVPLIGMYAAYHLVEDALSLYEQISEADLVLWTSMISKFSRCGESQLSLDLYVRMLAEGTIGSPNEFTFSTLLSSCAQLAAVDAGMQIHAQVLKSDSHIKDDKFVMNSLFYMYAKGGYIDEAFRLWSGMVYRDLVSWNAMISSLAQHGFAQKAIELFQELLAQKNMVPNNITYVAVLSACSRTGMLEKGYKYFKSIKEPTVDHYACLIDMFGRGGKLKEAFQFVQGMPFEGNERIWSSLLAASCQHGNIELGEYSAKKLIELNPSDPGTYVALSNLYAAAGQWENVIRVRKLMKTHASRKRPGTSWLKDTELAAVRAEADPERLTHNCKWSHLLLCFPLDDLQIALILQELEAYSMGSSTSALKWIVPLVKAMVIKPNAINISQLSHF